VKIYVENLHLLDNLTRISKSTGEYNRANLISEYENKKILTEKKQAKVVRNNQKSKGRPLPKINYHCNEFHAHEKIPEGKLPQKKKLVQCYSEPNLKHKELSVPKDIQNLGLESIECEYDDDFVR